MADLSTYDGLCATVADWLNRADLTAIIPTFVALAEAGMGKDERFRTQSLTVRSQALLTSAVVTLPPDYLEMTALRLVGVAPQVMGSETLEYMAPADLDEIRSAYASGGQPRYYTIVGKSLEVLPAPDKAYTAEMLYYGRAPALSSTNQTNVILANHPDLYLYGVLMQAAPYLKDDERIAVWSAAYGTLAEQLKVHTERGRYGGAPLKMRTRSFG
jgi:hypothetical protein